MEFATFNFFFCLTDVECMKSKFFIVFYLFCLQLLPAEIFKFYFEDGQKYRINSFVNENIFFNMNFLHNSEIANRITVEVSDVKEKPIPSALYNCTFMITERSTAGSFFTWDKQYPSIFRRNEQGEYEIGKQYFMPVVRNVPILPEYDVKPGDTWMGEGHEAHDFQKNFGLKEPFIVPFKVQYTYIGPVERNGKKQHLIMAEYDLMHDVPQELIQKNKNHSNVFPVTTLGSAKQNLYWDTELGNLTYYDEQFSIRLVLNTGDVLDYVGTAYAEVTDLEIFDRKKTLDDVKTQLDNLGLDDIEVKETEEGITLSIEDIHFLSDSAVLMQSEKDKLDKIAKVLKKYPERDLLISGHTALAGTKDKRDALSLERANAVTKYLIEKGVRESHRIFTKGFGSERPVAPNTTEKNRAKNRRVEITIIDK